MRRSSMTFKVILIGSQKDSAFAGGVWLHEKYRRNRIGNFILLLRNKQTYINIQLILTPAHIYKVMVKITFIY